MSRRTIKNLCIVCIGFVVSSFSISSAASRDGQFRTANHGSELEVLPKHFVLHPGEQIHYTVLQHSAAGQLRFADATFVIAKPKILRVIRPGVFEALAPGRTELVVRTQTSEGRVTIEVGGHAQPSIPTVPHSIVGEIGAKVLLFVGHANRDGFDYTAVAKPGIDRLVQAAKKRGSTVVYWISEEYPNWYTEDRHPDYAIVSEGQEHQIRFNAQRIIFTGGDFMFCLLRNAQMTLHGMVKNGRPQRITFVFPVQAIWAEDIWGTAEKRPYPAPMVLLKTLFARRPDDTRTYAEVVVPFLDRMITEFPVAGYPADAPTPPLNVLLKDWNIVARFSDGFERVYRVASSHKTLTVSFQGLSAPQRRMRPKHEIEPANQTHFELRKQLPFINLSE